MDTSYFYTLSTFQSLYSITFTWVKKLSQYCCFYVRTLATSVQKYQHQNILKKKIKNSQSHNNTLYYFFLLSFPCPCLGVFPGNKGCDRASDHAQKGCGAALTMRIVQCVRQRWGYNSLCSFVLFTMNDLSQTDTVTDPHVTDTDSVAHFNSVPPV